MRAALRLALGSVLRHRLFHFLALGALVAAFAPKERDARAIVIDEGRLTDALRAEEARAGRPLTTAEKAHVKDALVDEEVLAREALRLGVATDDAVVRARLAQRMRVRIGGNRSAAPRETGPKRRVAVWFAPTEREAAVIAHSIREDGKEKARGLGARPPIPDGAVWSETDLASVAGVGAARAAFRTEIGQPTSAVASAWGFYVFVPLETFEAEPSAPATDDAAVERFVRKARAEYRIEGVN